MSDLTVGDKLQIQCYKHNVNIHSAWDEAILLEENNEYLVFGNNKTIVTKAEGITWKTKEPAIMYFFKEKWFNIIAQLKSDGVYYYCNIASPFIIEEGVIKYIDYDLDLRVFPTGQYKNLDKLEYNYHKDLMGYSKELDKVITGALEQLINEYNSSIRPFNTSVNKNYYHIYKSIVNERKNKGV